MKRGEDGGWFEGGRGSWSQLSNIHTPIHSSLVIHFKSGWSSELCIMLERGGVRGIRGINWVWVTSTLDAPLGRFPQICTVCYSVTLNNTNINPWSWSKIVNNTFSVCTNNITKHIGSPPRPFICFLQFILIKGMSHCNICWFKYFGNVKKDNYSAKI